MHSFDELELQNFAKVHLLPKMNCDLYQQEIGWVISCDVMAKKQISSPIACKKKFLVHTYKNKMTS